MIAFWRKEVAVWIFVFVVESILTIVVASVDLASPTSIFVYLSRSTSYSVEITFAFASIPSFSKIIVTVSHRLTRSSGAISLYSSVCHKAIKDTSMLTFGIPISLSSIYF